MKARVFRFGGVGLGLTITWKHGFCLNLVLGLWAIYITKENS